ncbi:MAG: type II toxin-antitoxin system prevent-host-death family antitoxin [Gammaproteobacteria bacterium]|nr:type II toxin-antitoxin system prevent-host-death family antitoxin [Gammaproteobacteria bacterium]
MLQVKITDLRAHLPDYLRKVSNGEEIQVTSHGKPVARLVPELTEVEAAQKRLDALRGTMMVGDVLAPLDSQWSADADNL